MKLSRVTSLLVFLVLTAWAMPAAAQVPSVTSATFADPLLTVVGERLAGASSVTVGGLPVSGIIVNPAGTLLMGTVVGTLADGTHLLSITTTATAIGNCPSPQPGADWLCVGNGNWVPPDHPLASTSGSSKATTSTTFVVTVGSAGSVGPQGAPGAPGATGAQGPAGATGATGAAGAPGGVLAFADFFALMPPDNAATVAVGSEVAFPQDGPMGGAGIARIGASTFNLAEIGAYNVTFQVSVSEAGQLVLKLNNVELPYTVVGRATGTSQIVGTAVVSTVAINSQLSVGNPASESTALTITPLAGGTEPVSAHLVIMRIQ
jgi:hypothetical protein